MFVCPSDVLIFASLEIIFKNHEHNENLPITQICGTKIHIDRGYLIQPNNLLFYGCNQIKTLFQKEKYVYYES